MLCCAWMCVQEQVGPYVHRVYHEKLDVLWDADGRVYFKVWACSNSSSSSKGTCYTKQGCCGSFYYCSS
jgi:hypothetical protein